MKFIVFVCCLLLPALFVYAQEGHPPKVLVVSAHPDDETTFPVTIYKITHHLKGTVDLFLITDGQGGYSGSELGSEYYGINLSDSLTGRSYLPAIRKRELMQAGKIMGIRNYTFMDQPDDFYSRQPEPYLAGKTWDVKAVEKKLDEVLKKNMYDFVFVLLPHGGQHAHHKTASILALRAISRINRAQKPVILGVAELTKKDTLTFTGLPGYAETRVTDSQPIYAFDRTMRFGTNNQLSYRIVADWVYAEYKSQGDLQESEMHHDELEVFWYFALNGKENREKAIRLFNAIDKSGHPNGNPK